MKCPNCGNEIANDCVFCEYCGSQIKNENSKQVDIRWSLLPAMIIATIAMGLAAESYDIFLYGGADHNVMPFFVIPLCIFIVSCWYGIKKLIPTSCVIMIVILFCFSCKILYDSVNPHVVYYYESGVSWDNDNDYKSGSGYVNLRSTFDYYIRNHDGAEADLRSCAEALKKKFNEGGKNVFVEGVLRGEERYTGWKGYEAFFYISIFLIIYLIYAILAHRKGWKF